MNAYVSKMTIESLPAAIAPEETTIPEAGIFDNEFMIWIGIVTICIAIAVGVFLAGLRAATPSQMRQERAIRRASGGTALQSISTHATEIADRSLSRSNHRTDLDHILEQAGLSIRSSEFLVLVVATTSAAFAVGWLFTSLIPGLVISALVVVAFKLFITRRTDRRHARFAEQLELTLPLMAGSLRAGFGLMQSLDNVAREAQSPTAEEFRRVVAETRLGRDLGECLAALAVRQSNEDFAWVAEAISIHQQIGGDLAEVLDNVYATIRDRNKMKRQIQALAGEGKLSAIILFLLPIGMFLYISTVNSEYIGELTQNSLGIILLIGSAVMMVLGGFWMKRIVRLIY